MIKYITRSAESLKAVVNQLALDVMVPIDTYIADDRAEKQNVLMACYNDGIRCFAEMLVAKIDEEAEKQE